VSLKANQRKQIVTPENMLSIDSMLSLCTF
jgi:hypothetical protein